MQSLDIVIVTFNRLEKLKKTLQHYIEQTQSFRTLIVIDNCSNDGTKEYLDEWECSTKTSFSKVIIHGEDNLGGSGGFYIGQKKALELGADWVLVADDDAYADSNMVEEFYKYIETHETNNTAAICAEVLNMDGSICVNHRDTYKIENASVKHFVDKFSKEFIRETSKEKDYEKESFAVDILSYVGSFLNVKALSKVGLVNPDYFIYLDDSEHSIRLKQFGDIIVVPAIKITHDSGADTMFSDPNIETSWRHYYFKRNYCHMLLKHYPSCILREYYWLLRAEIGMLLHKPHLSESSKLERTAMWDAFFPRLGKHSLYRPGWVILKQ